MSSTNDLILQMNITDALMQLTTERFCIHDETLVVFSLTPEPLTTPCRKHSLERLSIITDILLF